MPVFLPPTRASHKAKIAYTIAYLRKMAENNHKLATAHLQQGSFNIRAHYHDGRASAFAEAADRLEQLSI